MTNAKKDIKYYFPLFVPFLLVIFDFLSKLLLGEVSTCFVKVFVELSVIVLFCFITIDVWGITMSITEEKVDKEIAMLWFFIMFFHLVLYEVGLVIQKYTNKITIVTDPSGYLMLFSIILVIVAFIPVLYGRNKLWENVEKSIEEKIYYPS